MKGTRQQRIMALLRQRLTIILLLVLVLLLIPAVWSAFGKEIESRGNRIRAEAYLAQQLERKDSLEQEVKILSSEQGIEDALRHRFDVGREGEGVIYIVDPVPTSTTNEPSSWDSFFGRIRSIWPF